MKIRVWIRTVLRRRSVLIGVRDRSPATSGHVEGAVNWETGLLQAPPVMRDLVRQKNLQFRKYYGVE